MSCGDGVITRDVDCKIFLEFSRTVAVLPDDQCPGTSPSRERKCSMHPCPHSLVRYD